jgi:hypothetical protein
MEAERQRWIRESLTHQARARDEALLAAQAGEQAPAALGSEVRAYLIETWQQTAAHFANPADVRTRMSSSNERRESMPKKRVSRRALRWSDLLGQAVQAQQAKDWERVERLLGQLQSAPDTPPKGAALAGGLGLVQATSSILGTPGGILAGSSAPIGGHALVGRAGRSDYPRRPPHHGATGL